MQRRSLLGGLLASALGLAITKKVKANEKPLGFKPSSMFATQLKDGRFLMLEVPSGLALHWKFDETDKDIRIKCISTEYDKIESKK